MSGFNGSGVKRERDLQVVHGGEEEEEDSFFSFVEEGESVEGLKKRVRNLEEMVRREREEKMELGQKLDRFKNGVSKACVGIRKRIRNLRGIKGRNGVVGGAVQEGLEKLEGFVEEQVRKWEDEGMVDEEEMGIEEDAIATRSAVQNGEALNGPEVMEVAVLELKTPVMTTSLGGDHDFAEEESVCLRKNLWTCVCGKRARNKAGLVNHIRIAKYGSFRHKGKGGHKKRAEEMGDVTVKSEIVTVTTTTPYNTRRKRMSKVALNFCSPAVAPPSPPSSESSGEGGSAGIAQRQVKTEPLMEERGGSSKVISGETEKTKKNGVAVQRKGVSRKISRRQHGVNPRNPLKCLCGLVTTHGYLLRRHIDYYRRDRTFACQLCPKLFVNQGYLNTHYRTVHKGSKVIPAVDGRKRKYRNIYNLSLVKLEPLDASSSSAQPQPSTSASSFQAFKPSFSFRLVSKKRRNALRRKRKLLRITAKERINCPVCYRRFPHLRDLAMHLARRIHGAEPYIAGTAGKRQRNRSATGGGKGKASNGSCSSKSAAVQTSSVQEGMVTRRKSFLLRSPSKQRGLEEGEKCVCGKLCNPRQYRRKRPPHCSLCRMKFVCKEVLRKHLWNVHSLEGRGYQQQQLQSLSSICSKCGAGFRSAKALENHKKTWHGWKLTVVKEEPETSKQKQPSKTKAASGPSKSQPQKKLRNVQVHRQVKIHLKGMSHLFKCSCGKMYGNDKSLKKHLRERLYGNVFRCDLCSYRFTKYFNMKVHKRDIHGISLEEQDRFGCGTCGMTFENNGDRILHRLKVHGQQNGQPLTVIPEVSKKKKKKSGIKEQIQKKKEIKGNVGRVKRKLRK